MKVLELDTPTMNARRVLERLSKIGFDKNLLRIDPGDSILAGGAVANTIINMVHNRSIRVNDFDIFVHRPSTEHILAEAVVTVDEDELLYPREFVKRVEMVERYQTGDVDFIYTRVLDMYKMPIPDLDEAKFREVTLSSFDLNCVQAGIYWDTTEHRYRLLVTDDFINFLYTDTVEIVNIHAVVTIARMLKKAYDLGANLNLQNELKVIGTACNPDNLSPMTTEQEKKHAMWVHAMPLWLDTLRSRPAEMQELYDAFANLGPMLNRRQIKIRIIRAYLEANKAQRDIILYILNHGSENYIAEMSTQKNILRWIGDGLLSPHDLACILTNVSHEAIHKFKVLERFTLPDLLLFVDRPVHETLEKLGLLTTEDKLYLALVDLEQRDIWG